MRRTQVLSLLAIGSALALFASALFPVVQTRLADSAASASKVKAKVQNGRNVSMEASVNGTSAKINTTPFSF